MIIVIISKATMTGTIAAFPGLRPATQDAVAALQTFLQTFLLLVGIGIYLEAPSLVLHFNSESFDFAFATFSDVSVGVIYRSTTS